MPTPAIPTKLKTKFSARSAKTEKVLPQQGKSWQEMDNNLPRYKKDLLHLKKTKERPSVHTNITLCSGVANAAIILGIVPALRPQRPIWYGSAGGALISLALICITKGLRLGAQLSRIEVLFSVPSPPKCRNKIRESVIWYTQSWLNVVDRRNMLYKPHIYLPRRKKSFYRRRLSLCYPHLQNRYFSNTCHLLCYYSFYQQFLLLEK